MRKPKAQLRSSSLWSARRCQGWRPINPFSSLINGVQTLTIFPFKAILWRISYPQKRVTPVIGDLCVTLTYCMQMNGGGGESVVRHMHVCVCVYVRTRTQIHALAQVGTQLTHTLMHTQACIHTRTHTCTRMCSHTHVHLHVHTHSALEHTLLYAHTDTHARTHTHTHTHTFFETLLVYSPGWP